MRKSLLLLALAVALSTGMVACDSSSPVGPNMTADALDGGEQLTATTHDTESPSGQKIYIGELEDVDEGSASNETGRGNQEF